jgi:AdoMet-dependent heme synthase
VTITGSSTRLDFAQRPILVFWETTRACLLACRHCRASAIPRALPDQLSTDEAKELIRQVVAFGRPYPVLVLTGGDCLMRPDIFELATYAGELGLALAMSPSVTPLLQRDRIARMRRLGVKAVSISLDGARAVTHDSIRGVPGHFAQTVDILADLVAAGIKVQVNTTVMRENVRELADLAALIKSVGVQMWEVFFLVHVGRGVTSKAIGAEDHEAVCHFLVDASRYGFLVRTVEAPFFRRVVTWRRALPPEANVAATFGLSPLYSQLRARLLDRLGPPGERLAAQSVSTRDGKGVVFVAHNGEVFPAGFLPLALGNVRRQQLSNLYRDSPLLQAIRRAQFTGRCGRCEFREVCGGSRARAFAATGDPLGEDPACPYLASDEPPVQLVPVKTAAGL